MKRFKYMTWITLIIFGSCALSLPHPFSFYTIQAIKEGDIIPLFVSSLG